MSRHSRIFLIATKRTCSSSQSCKDPSLVFVIYCINKSFTVHLTVLVKALCADLEGLECKF